MTAFFDFNPIYLVYLLAAASAVFGEATVPMSSIKALTGHALGASSALEAAACVLALGRQTAPAPDA